MQQRLELTIRSSVIGIILAVLLCGANTYLGLKIGTTISASIPASVISMGILHMLKRYSILENNIAQTIASAGEGIAAMVIFVFPALLILGVWHNFNYWIIFLMALCGGIIGIVFSIVLRKVLLNDESLPFPEGQAIGQVLLASQNTKNKTILFTLLSGIGIAAVFNFCQAGLQIFASEFYKFSKYGKGIIGSGISFSPAAIGAGYLIGFNNGLVIFFSATIAWFVLLPIFTTIYGVSDPNNLTNSAFTIWKEFIRPIGIGVFIFSGFSTILVLLKPIISGVKESVFALKNLSTIDNTENDINIKFLSIILLLASIPVTLFIFRQINALSSYSTITNIAISIGLMLLILVVGFITASVAGYFAGLIGSSNSPGSSLLLIAVIILTLSLLTILHGYITTNIATLLSTIIALVGFIGFASIITNENIQDYKSGQMVGATAYKQQIALFFGVIASAFVAPLFIQLIFQAYGIAGIAPHAGINPNTTLSAPQASGVALLTQNIIDNSQDWNLLIYGFIIGFIALALDIIGRYSQKFRCPILAVGIGLYLPPSLGLGLFVGGVLKFVIQRQHKKITKQSGNDKVEALIQKTNLFICGLIAGESLMGLLLSIPFVIKQNSNALKIVSDSFNNIATLLSVVCILLLLIFTYKLSQKETLR